MTPRVWPPPHPDRVRSSTSGAMWAVLGLVLLVAPSTVSVTDVWGSTDPCDGGWTKVSAPYVEGHSTELVAVDVLTASDAWAAGVDLAGGAHSMIQHWDGGTWTDTPMIEPDPIVVADIEAISPDDVWAVGLRDPASSSQNVALHWDGAWTVTPTPELGRGSVLGQVEAVGPDDVWAVGRVGPPGLDTVPLALHWNGIAWSQMTSGLDQFGQLVDLAVEGATVWTVQRRGAAGSTRVFAWDGSSWVPDPTAPNLIHIDAPVAGPLWGLGLEHKAFHLKAGTWVKEQPPVPPAGYRDHHFDLAVAGPGQVWLAGYLTDGAVSLPGLQRWDRHSWAIEDVPGKGRITVLNAVDVADGRGFAVGYHRDHTNGPSKPFVLTACGL